MLRRPLRYTRKPGSRVYVPARTSGPDVVRHALTFPSNLSGSDTSAPLVAIRFANPQSNGLPIWGPSGAGVTVIRRVKIVQQTGYYAQFWWCRGDGNFDPSQGYWGFHPYPTTGSNSGTSHYQEIATGGGDMMDTRAGLGTRVDTVKGSWRIEALRVERIGASNKLFTFYTDLPTTANATVVEGSVTTTNYGESDPPSPIVMIGDSPWYNAGYQHERASCQHGQIKVISKALSQADILSEAANMDQLATADGLASIWWGKKGFASVDDLTCDYGTGRTFVWADTSNKGTLGEVL